MGLNSNLHCGLQIVSWGLNLIQMVDFGLKSHLDCGLGLTSDLDAVRCWVLVLSLFYLVGIGLKSNLDNGYGSLNSDNGWNFYFSHISSPQSSKRTFLTAVESDNLAFSGGRPKGSNCPLSAVRMCVCVYQSQSGLELRYLLSFDRFLFVCQVIFSVFGGIL